jgi:hypothetical protein
MARQSERRWHLDLQVGMLSEQELTTILQMLQKLCQHVGVNVDSSKREVQSFSKQRTYTSWPVNSKTNLRRNKGGTQRVASDIAQRDKCVLIASQPGGQHRHELTSQMPAICHVHYDLLFSIRLPLRRIHPPGVLLVVVGRRGRHNLSQFPALRFVDLRADRASDLKAVLRQEVGRLTAAVGMIRDGHNQTVSGNPG